MERGKLVWVEAEDFAEKGAWRVDTQFTHLMGSAYLIAPGVGRPIGKAVTGVELPSDGTWRVWARTKDWVPEFHPGRFAVEIDDVRLGGVLGASGREGWRWEFAGERELGAGRHQLALEDLSGAYARCDALVLSAEADFVPPDDPAALASFRAAMTGAGSAEVADGGTYDVVVVGAGPAGMAAAVAAARSGARTALVHDRPVLGGNGSTEVGIHTNGSGDFQPNSRETGLVEEVNLLNPPEAGRWLTRGYEIQVAGERNLSVFTDERVVGVGKCGALLTDVVARNTRSGRSTRFRGGVFIDCTGDGWVACYAGARFMFGNDGQAAFGEKDAAEKPDRLTMSGCLCFFKHEMRDRPVAFETPVWAHKLPPDFTRSGIHGLAMPWWLEHPGDIDDLADAEFARDELIRWNFGYWGWLKNDWECRATAACAELVSVPFVNGRRESRRIVGDYVLREDDLASGRVFDDAIGHGGWSMDLHDPLGMSRNYGDGWNCFHENVPLYTIPFRALCSADVPNLMMAGRCMSASRLAFGSLRVGGTCAVGGQAAGTAAAMCVAKGVMPRELGAAHIVELQRRLVRDDQYIPGVVCDDPGDLARTARVTASSAQSELVYEMAHRPWGLGFAEPVPGPDGRHFRAAGASPAAVVDGVARVAENKAHAWVSDEASAFPQWIRLDWGDPVVLSQVRLVFDTNLALGEVRRYPVELVKSYAVEVLAGGAWRTVAEDDANILRHRVHDFAPVRASALRLTVRATYGAPSARVFEIRAY